MFYIVKYNHTIIIDLNEEATLICNRSNVKKNKILTKIVISKNKIL